MSVEANEIVKFVSDGFEKAKSGAALEVYAGVAELHSRNQLPQKSHYPFGWIIYYALHQSPANAIMERKQMLARYLELSVTKPHKLHSMILTEAIRLYKDASSQASLPSNAGRQNPAVRFSIVRFFDLWNPAYLRPGDHRRKEHEGRELPSTVEKLITHYVDELYSTRTPASGEFMQLALRALADYPGSDNICAQVARLYELGGEREKAVEMLRNAILASSSKFYLWDRLADLVNGEDGCHRLAVSLLYKALLAPGQEDFKGRIRMKLAKVMTDAGAPAHARWELETVRKMYEAKGWNLPRLYRETMQRIPADTVAMDPAPVYRKLAPLADVFVYEALPDISVSKTYHKPSDSARSRTAWRVTDAGGRNYWLQPSRFGIQENLPMGTQLAVKLFNGKVVQAVLTDGAHLPLHP